MSQKIPLIQSLEDVTVATHVEIGEYVGPPYLSISELTLVGDSVAYVGEKSEGKVVNVEGEEGPVYDDILELDVIADKVAYVGRKDRLFVVHHGEWESGEYSDLKIILYERSCTYLRELEGRLLFAGINSEGKMGYNYAGRQEPFFVNIHANAGVAVVGNNLTYPAQTEAGWVIVSGETRSELFSNISLFSADDDDDDGNIRFHHESSSSDHFRSRFDPETGMVFDTHRILRDAEGRSQLSPIEEKAN